MNTEMNYITNNVSFNVRQACVEIKFDRLIMRCEINVSVCTLLTRFLSEIDVCVCKPKYVSRDTYIT